MTGSRELAHSVMLARNTRWFCGAVLAPVATGLLAVTSAQAAGNAIHDIFTNQPVTWDLAKMPALSLGTLIGSQSPSFLANNYMVHMAKQESTDLSASVMAARKWRNRKRVLETVGVVMLPTFLPDGLKGGVFSGIPLTGALVSRLAEAVDNAESHRRAKMILHPERVKPRRIVSIG